MSVTYKRHPDFLVIGGLCCATSALTAILRQRPEIALRGNSVDLRDDHYLGDVERDLSRFSNVFSSLDPNKLCGAIMPHYLGIPGVAEKLHELAADSRLVVVLRDPLDRLRSHYLYNVAAGYEPHPFEVSIQQEENRCRDPEPLSLVRFGYLHQGCYAELLQPFREQFEPDQLHVIFMTGLLQDTENELRRLYKFLGFMKTHDVELRKNTDWISSVDIYRQNIPSRYPGLQRALGPISRALGRTGAPGRDEQHAGMLLGKKLAHALHPLPPVKQASVDWIRNFYRDNDESLAEWLAAPLPWSHQRLKTLDEENITPPGSDEVI